MRGTCPAPSLSEIRNFCVIYSILSERAELEPDNFFVTGPVWPVQNSVRSGPTSNWPVDFRSQTGKNPARLGRQGMT